MKLLRGNVLSQASSPASISGACLEVVTDRHRVDRLDQPGVGDDLFRRKHARYQVMAGVLHG